MNLKYLYTKHINCPISTFFLLLVLSLFYRINKLYINFVLNAEFARLSRARRDYLYKYLLITGILCALCLPALGVAISAVNSIILCPIFFPLKIPEYNLGTRIVVRMFITNLYKIKKIAWIRHSARLRLAGWHCI